MSQNDMTVDNSTGAVVRADINSALQALATNSSGSSAPSTTFALQTFANTTDSMLQLRNAANNAFVNLRKFDGTLPLPDGSASSPSLFFDDDTNTGLFSSAADTLDISTGGTTRATFSSAGVTVPNAATITSTGNASLVFDCGTGNAGGNQVSFIDFKINGTVKSNIAVNEATSGNPLELGSAGNGAVHMFFDNSLKLNTQSTGVKVTSTLQVGDDAGSILLGNSDGFSPTFTENAGGLEFRSNNSKRFTFTLGGDMNFENNRKLAFGGTNQALQLYHDGSNAYIDVGTGAGVLHLRSKDDIKLQTDMSDLAVKCDANGAVELYHDATKQFETTSVGCQLKGQTRFATSAGTFCALTEVKSNTSHSANADLVFQTINGHQGGTVTVTLTRNGNAAIKSTKQFPIMINSTSSATVGSQLFNVDGTTGGVTFTVTGAGQGVNVRNTSGDTCTTTVRFDLAGSTN